MAQVFENKSFKLSSFVPLVESGICLLVDVATLSTIYDVRHPLLLPGYPTQELISRPQAVRHPSSTPPCLRPSVLRCWRALLLCVLPFCNLFPRSYIRRRLIPYYDSGPLHKHQIYIRPIFHVCSVCTDWSINFIKS